MNMTRSALAVLWLAMGCTGAGRRLATDQQGRVRSDRCRSEEGRDAGAECAGGVRGLPGRPEGEGHRQTHGVCCDREAAQGLRGRAISWAARSPATRGCVLLMFLCTKVYDKASVKLAVDSLLAHHVKSAGLTDILENAMALSSLAGKEQAESLLARVIAENPHPLPKAWDWQASTIQRDKAATAEMKAKAEQMLAEAEQLAAGSLLADRIAAPRFIKENLQIGMTAPNIAGPRRGCLRTEGLPRQGRRARLLFW